MSKPRKFTLPNRYDPLMAQAYKDARLLKLFNALPDEWQVFFYILLESVSKPTKS